MRLLLPPAQELEIKRISELLAKGWATLDVAYSAAAAKLPYPVPLSESPYAHDAYQEFLRHTSELGRKIRLLYLEPSQAENLAIVEPDSERRTELLHRLGGVHYHSHPPISAWYQQVKSRRLAPPLFRGEQ